MAILFFSPINRRPTDQNFCHLKKKKKKKERSYAIFHLK